MRTMAIDFGDQRIGLAVSDLLGMLTGEAWTMEEWNMERAAKRIAEAAKERDVGTYCEIMSQQYDLHPACTMLLLIALKG